MSDQASAVAPEEKRGRGRSPGFVMAEEHRTKIRNSKILSRLMKCAEGEIELTPVQAQVGLGLIKKILPDLATTTLQGDEDGGAIKTDTVTRIMLCGPDDHTKD